MGKGSAAMVAAAIGVGMLAPASAHSALSYVVSPTTTTGTATQGSASVSCPGSTFVIGGGAFSSGGYGAVAITTTYPSTNASWTEDTDVHSGTQNHQAFAICETTMPTRVFESKLIPPGEERTPRAECPAGEHVYGGGYIAGPNYGTTNTRSSRPYDDGDPDKDRDDGWEATTFNFFPTAPTETIVSVFCGPKESTTRVKTTRIAPASQKGVRKSCRAGERVTGGGAHSTGSQGNNWISSTSPEDTADNDLLTDDRWEGYLENDLSTRQEIKAYVVCR